MYMHLLRSVGSIAAVRVRTWAWRSSGARAGRRARSHRILPPRHARLLDRIQTLSDVPRIVGVLWVTRHYPGEGCRLNVSVSSVALVDISPLPLFHSITTAPTEMLRRPTDTLYHPASSLADITRLTYQATHTYSI